VPDVGYWILDAGYWMLDTGGWMLDTGCWTGYGGLIPDSGVRHRHYSSGTFIEIKNSPLSGCSYNVEKVYCLL